jgi:hypothetical protein
MHFCKFHLNVDGEDLDSLDIDIVEDSILLQVEADTFWSLNKLFEGIQENYTFAQPGIQKMLFALEELIRRIDGSFSEFSQMLTTNIEPLHKHFTDQGISFTQFAYRWMNCYLLRELPFTLILRMFDSYLAEEGGSSAGFSNTHVYFCAALLISFSSKIKACLSCNASFLIFSLATRISRLNAIYSASSIGKAQRR